MRECKSCKVKLNNNEINCPLCGAHTYVIDEECNIVSGEYPLRPLKKSAKVVVKNIFIALSILLLAAFGLVSILTKNVTFVAIVAFVELYIWLAIFNNIFSTRNLAHILASVFMYTIIAVNLICLHYFMTKGNDWRLLNASVGIVTPILLGALNITYMMIVFISQKWYKYAFQTIVLSILEIGMLVLTILVNNITYVGSIVCAGLGLATIVFSFVFGKEVMLTEFKKRLHL